MQSLNRVHIQAPGLNKFLGSIETSIMLAVWAGASTARDIHTTIIRSDKDLAFTTVTTVLERLTRKELLRRGSNGSCATYTPTYPDETTFTYAAIQAVVMSLLDDYPDEFSEITGVKR